MKNKQINMHLPLKTFMTAMKETRELCVGLLLSLKESLVSIGGIESYSFHAIFSRNLFNYTWFYLLLKFLQQFYITHNPTGRERRPIDSVVIT